MKTYEATITFNITVEVPDDFDPEKDPMPREEHLRTMNSIINYCHREIEAQNDKDTGRDQSA